MVILGLFLTILLGWVVVWLLDFKLSNIGKLAISYLVGIGLQTLFMFYLSILHIPLNLINVVLAICLLMILMFLFGKIVMKRKTYLQSLMKFKFPSFRNISSWDKVRLILFLLTSIYVLSAGIYWPVVGWDSIALYDFRAKVFSATGFMDEAIRRGYFFGYPLMTSMAHTWIYLLGGIYPKFLYSLMYLSLGVLFYEMLLKWTNKITSLFFTLLVLLAPPIFAHAAFDYTNLPYTIYFFLGSVFLVVWDKEKNTSWLILSSIMMGLATWVRSTDPFWTVNIMCLLVMVVMRKRKFYNIVLYLVPFFLIQQSWSLFLAHNAPHVTTGGIASRSIKIILSEFNIERMLEAVVFVIDYTFPTLLPYIILAILSIISSRKTTRGNLALYLIVAGNFGLLFLGTYIFSYIYPGWDLIGESLGRMSFIFIPLFLFLTAINIDLKKLFNFK